MRELWVLPPAAGKGLNSPLDRTPPPLGYLSCMCKGSQFHFIEGAQLLGMAGNVLLHDFICVLMGVVSISDGGLFAACP